MEDNRASLKATAKALGATYAETTHGDAYDIVYAFAEGFAIGDESYGDRPKSLLAQLSALDDLQSAINATIKDLVGDAREAGASWSQVGDALSTTKQAAQQRYGR